MPNPPARSVCFFDNQTAPVWDLSGNPVLEQTLIGTADIETPLAFQAVSLMHDSKGKLSGSGDTILNVGNDFVAAQYTLNGKVSGGGNSVNRASFNVRLTGEDVIAGVITRFSIKIRYELEADAGELVFVGTARGNANFTGLSSSKIRSDVTMQLPAGMDGSWTLNMNIIPLNKLSGSAEMVLSNGRVLPATLNGSFSSSTGVSKLKIKGVGAGAGSNVSLRLFESVEEEEPVLAIEKLEGKILGQKVRQDVVVLP